MFDIQHHDNPSSRNRTLRDLVRILLATVTPPVHALPTGSVLFTLGARALRVEPVRWSLVVQYGAERGGSVRVYITRQFEPVRAGSIQSACVNGLLVLTKSEVATFKVANQMNVCEPWEDGYICMIRTHT